MAILPINHKWTLVTRLGERSACGPINPICLHLRWKKKTFFRLFIYPILKFSCGLLLSSSYNTKSKEVTMNIGDAIWEIFKWKTSLEGYKREKQSLKRNVLITFGKRHIINKILRRRGKRWWEPYAAPCSLRAQSQNETQSLVRDNWQIWDGSKLGQES